jgi:hypothetical protein
VCTEILENVSQIGNYLAFMEMDKSKFGNNPLKGANFK